MPSALSLASALSALPNPGRSLHRRLTLWFWLVTLFGVAVTGALTYRLIIPAMLGEVGQKLEAVAAGAAAGIDGDRFASLRNEAATRSPAYAAIRAQLQRVRAANANIRFRYLYTMVPGDRPGVWRYVVDSEPERSQEFSALGETETLKDGDCVTRAFRSGRAASDRDLRHYPGWGPLLTAAAPILTADGRVVGVVGVDAAAPAVQQVKDTLFGILGGCLLLGMLTAAVAGAAVAWNIARPIGRLKEAAEQVAGGDFSQPVPVEGRDELGVLAQTFNQMVHGLKQRELYKAQFERYVSRQVAEKILNEPERDFWQGERRRATILFCDIRGFTTMAETLTPEEVVGGLNEYLRVMIDVVFEHDGTLDKFIGDAVMAVFGAPVSTGNDEERAVRAALAMQDAVRKLNEKWRADGQHCFKIGIGINSGDVVVGNIGSERRLEYAAIGDHVNLAARLERLTKQYDADILVSRQTYEAVQDLVEARRLGAASLQGRAQSVEVFEVLGLRGDPPPAPLVEDEKPRRSPEAPPFRRALAATSL